MDKQTNKNKMKNPNQQNLEFLSQLLSLVFPGEFQQSVLLLPDNMDFLIQTGDEDHHLNLYISPKRFTNTDKDIISPTPFNYFKPEYEEAICPAWGNPKSAPYWDKVLYIPGFTLYCLKSEYLTITL